MFVDAVASAARLEASDTKATKRPSAEIDGVSEKSSAAAPPWAADAPADEGRRPGVEIPDEDALLRVEILGGEVVGLGREGDEAPVGRDRRRLRGVVGRRPGAGAG